MGTTEYTVFELIGQNPKEAKCLVVWGHGWGQDHSIFKPFFPPLESRAAHIVVDFPGFGQSPVPSETWTTADYADDLAKIIESHRSVNKIIYVGHSFGGRVGIQLAARRPDLVDGLFLIGSAGLPRKRGFFEKAAFLGRVYTFKTLKHLAPLLGLSVEALRGKFGSPDYRSAGPLRTLFVKIIAEDLSVQAQKIKCPVHFFYGEKDTETPVEIGERLHALIPGSTLTILPRQDHYTVLGEGRHVIVKRLAEFIGYPS